MKIYTLALLALTTLLTACAENSVAPAAELASGDAAAEVAATSDPNFLEIALGAPAVINPVVSVWVKKGTEKIFYMWYGPRPGHTDSTVFMRFRVRKRSLGNYPNGAPIADGDSILITATLIDAVNQIIDFQPSGLVFVPGELPKLKISYFETDPDWNDDGAVNQSDTRVQRLFDIWQQHAALPWAPLPSAVSVGSHEVEASIPGFTSYAVAY